MKIHFLAALALTFCALFGHAAYAAENSITAYGVNNNAREQFFMPSGVSYAEGGGVIVADTLNNCVRIITNGNTRVFAGKIGAKAGFIDGKAENAMFNAPLSVAAAKDGAVYVCDTGNNVIRRIRGGYVDTIAGAVTPGFSDGRAASVMFNMPSDIAVSDAGDIYIADTLNHCIRKMDAAGNVTLFAGTPGIKGNGGGERLKAQFFEPSGVAVDKNGAVYVADTANHSIKVIENGIVSTISGRPGALDMLTGYYEGGFLNGSTPLFNYPKGLAVAGDGSVYVSDTFNHAIRRVLRDGSAVTISGIGGSGKYYNNYKNAMFTRPVGIVATDTELFIADSLNDAVLKLPLNNETKKGLPTKSELRLNTGVSGYYENIAVCFNKVFISFGDKPKKTYETFTLPLTDFFIGIGATANYTPNAKEITVTKGGLRATLKEGTHFVSDNGVYMLYVDAISDVFPYIVQWYPDNNLLIVEE